MLLLKNIPKNHFPNNKDVPIRNDHFYADKYLQRYGSRDRNGGRKLGFRGDGRGDEGSDEEDDEGSDEEGDEEDGEGSMTAEEALAMQKAREIQKLEQKLWQTNRELIRLRRKMELNRTTQTPTSVASAMSMVDDMEMYLEQTPKQNLVDDTDLYLEQTPEQKLVDDMDLYLGQTPEQKLEKNLENNKLYLMEQMQNLKRTLTEHTVAKKVVAKQERKLLAWMPWMPSGITKITTPLSTRIMS